MTLFSTTSRIAYVGNGITTTFAYPFRVLEAVELAVWVAGDRKGLGSHYSMTGVDTPTGGTVTLFATPAAGVSVVLQRNMPITQPVDLREHDALSAETQEREYDRLTMLIQGQEDDHAHMLRLADNSPTILPPGSLPEPELGKFLRWHDPTHLDNAEVVSSGSLSIGGNVAGRATFWTAPLGLGGDPGFCWNPAARRLTVARGMHEENAPLTPHQDGLIFAFLKNSDNVAGYQGVLAHVHNGAPTDTLSTLGNDKVAIAGWTKRGFGGTSPIYGGNFGVVFSTPGVANGVEIDVQNDSGVDFQGQALWLNGSGGNHRANALLIDTQDSTKWQNGIKFTSNFGGGATGNVTNAGILFDHNQSQTHILIVPFDDANPSNNVFELRDSVFDQVRAGIQKRGAFAGRASATGFNDPTFTWTDSPRSGMYSPGIESLSLATNGFERLRLTSAGEVHVLSLVGSGTQGVSVTSDGRLIRGGGGGGGGGGPTSLVEIVPASGAATGEIHYLELAANGTNYVGWKAPDALAANIMWVLPTTDGTAGQVLTTSGAAGVPPHALSWTTPAGGGGAGVTSVGGVAGVVGITNDANVTLTGASPNLVVNWAGTLSKARGGTGGAGATSGQLGVWSLTGLTGDTGLSFDIATQALRVGLTPTNPRALSVTSFGPVARFERSDAGTGSGSGTALELVHTTSAAMGNGFDVLQNFVLRSAAVDRLAAVIRVYRDGSDTSHGWALSTTVGGSLDERMRINGTGQFFFTPTPTVGTFGLTANGTRTTELIFGTNNNLSSVGFVAPATSTGNHVWRLPSTFGAAGSVLRNDGAGNLSWAAGSATLGCNAKDYGAVSDGVTNDNAAINSAMAVCGTVFLPRNTKWIPSVSIPSNVNVLGEDATVVVDASAAAGSSGFLTVGSRGSLGNVAFRDNNGGPFYLGQYRPLGLSSAITSEGQEIALLIDKAGPTGSSNRPGMAINHLGLGTGDHYYASVNASSTEYRDAMFRGDLFKGAAFSGGIGPAIVFGGYLFAGSEPTAYGLRITDQRTAPTARQIHVLATVATAGMSIQAQAGAGRTFGWFADTGGNMLLQEEASAAVGLRFTAGSNVQFFKGASCRQLDIASGAWGACVGP